MADKYRRVQKALDKLPENEIRVRANVKIGRYLRRANDLLTGKVEGQDSVVIKGMSNAMESAVKLAELIKHRVKTLYQTTEISNTEIVDEYEPLEEGLDHLKFNRYVTMITIILSKNQLDRKHHGYQDPIPESEVQEFDDRALGERRPAGRGRYQERPRREEGDEERVRGGFRGGFRGGRGRGFRGGFRGGRGGYREDYEERRGSYRGGYENRRSGYKSEGRPRDTEEIDYEEDRPRRGGYRGGFRGGRGGYSINDRGEEGEYDRPPRRGGYGDRPPRRGGYEDRSPRRGGYEDRPPRRGGYEDRPPRRGGYEDRPPRRGGYEDRPSRRGGYEDRPPRRGGYEDRPPRDSYDRPPREYGDRPRGSYRGSEGQRGGPRGASRGGFRERDDQE